MVVGRQPVDHRHLRRVGQLRDHLVRACPHDDRLHVAGQDPRRVPHRLASRELELVATQDQGRAAELGHPDLERDPRAGRGLLEHQRDALARQSVGPLAARPPRLELERAVEQRAQLLMRELFAGEEVACHRKRRMVCAVDTSAMEIRAITWNLFHGRDFPETRRFTRGARALGERPSETPPTSRSTGSCFAEFATVLCAAPWDVALLAGMPAALVRGAGRRLQGRGPALAHLTQLAWLRARRPRLAGIPICSAPGRVARTSRWSEARIEGGLVDHRELVLRRRPERRTMAFARLGSGLCVANMHASTSPAMAAADVRRAVEAAVAWAGESPLILGGDFNLRPQPDRGCSRSSGRRFGLSAPTGPDSIDHILGRGLETVEPPARLAARGAGAALRGPPTAPLGPRSGRSEIRDAETVDPPAAGMR